MHIPSSVRGMGSDPVESLEGRTLKSFQSAGRGFWAHVPDSDWNSWQWQMKNRVTTLATLQKLMPTLSPEEHAGVQLANTKLARMDWDAYARTREYVWSVLQALAERG